MSTEKDKMYEPAAIPDALRIMCETWVDYYTAPIGKLNERFAALTERAMKAEQERDRLRVALDSIIDLEGMSGSLQFVKIARAALAKEAEHG